jgi:hypothetical protein
MSFSNLFSKKVHILSRGSNHVRAELVLRLAKYLQQLLALEAIAIGLHSTLVWDVAIGEEASDSNAQTSE